MRFLLGALVALVCLLPISDVSSQRIGAYSHGTPNLPGRQTPGKALPGVTSAQVCKGGYAGNTRDVNQAEKNAVYSSYGVQAHTSYCGTAGCEIDHLISLELGGSNDPANLWPQPYGGPINAHMKDRLEDYLHTIVCSGKITIQQAQQMISTNWIDTYNKYVGSMPGTSASGLSADDDNLENEDEDEDGEENDENDNENVENEGAAAMEAEVGSEEQQ